MEEIRLEKKSEKNIKNNVNKMDLSQFVRFEATIAATMIDLGIYDSEPEYAIQQNKKSDIEILSRAMTKSDFYSTSLCSKYREYNKKVTEKLAGKNEANTAGPCPTCGTDRFKVTAQRRSADEPMNHEIHCPGCNKIEYN